MTINCIYNKNTHKYESNYTYEEIFNLYQKTLDPIFVMCAKDSESVNDLVFRCIYIISDIYYDGTLGNENYTINKNFTFYHQDYGFLDFMNNGGSNNANIKVTLGFAVE